MEDAKANGQAICDGWPGRELDDVPSLHRVSASHPPAEVLGARLCQIGALLATMMLGIGVFGLCLAAVLRKNGMRRRQIAQEYREMPNAFSVTIGLQPKEVWRLRDHSRFRSSDESLLRFRKFAVADGILFRVQ